jgi:hypothetical protein
MREIKFEYGFQSVNGIVKKVYDLSYDCANETDEWHYKREVIGNIHETK